MNQTNNTCSYQRIVTVRKEEQGDQRILSKELLAGINKLIIEHAGEEYSLRITKAGKLILTK